ncbi:MAG: hypothetical protein JXQ94_05085 [Maricaulis maris]
MSEMSPHKKGYMKPPRSRQFKKGQSGNPKGGPRAVSAPDEILLKVLARRVKVAGSKKKVTMREAIFRKFRELVLTGDRQALKLAEMITNANAEAAQNNLQPKPIDFEAARRRIWSRLTNDNDHYDREIKPVIEGKRWADDER